MSVRMSRCVANAKHHRLNSSSESEKIKKHSVTKDIKKSEAAVTKDAKKLETFAAVGKSFEQLCKEFNYDSKTFWMKIPTACVVIADQHLIAKATKDLIAGLFTNEPCSQIMASALDLSFYSKCYSTDRSFIYDEAIRFVTRAAECTPNEVLVRFKLQGWFDKWLQISPKTTMEEEYLKFFKNTENDATIAFFGPWLATLLLRLSKKSPSEVAKKVAKYFDGGYDSKTAKSRQLPWKKEFADVWELLLKRFPREQPNKSKKNALFRAMIETTYISKDKQAINQIEFTYLQNLAFNGMMLVKMIDKFREERRALQLNDIVEATRTAQTSQSWDTYFGFLAFFYVGLDKTERHFAKYAREFDISCFNSLTYLSNVHLCNYLAMITDCGMTKDCFSVSNPGPHYQQLTSNRVNSTVKMTADDFRFCANVAEDLFIIECKPKDAQSCHLIAQCYKERAEEYKKLSEEAREMFLFHEMRSFKFRQLAEEYEELQHTF